MTPRNVSRASTGRGAAAPERQPPWHRPKSAEPPGSAAGPLRRVRAARWLACLLVLAAGRFPSAVLAQHDGTFSVGAVAGSPGGLSARFGMEPRPGARWSPDAVTALLSFDLDNYVLLNLHAVTDRALTESPITVFAGPGLAVGVDRRLAMAGIAAVFGLKFYRARFEIFMQGHPRIMLFPSLRAFPGAGVGFRFHP